MRFLLRIAAILAVAGFGFAAGGFALALLPSEDVPFAEPQRAPALAPVVVVTREAPESWPAVFGKVQEAAPEPEPEPDQPPEIVAAPEPEENTTYWLTGLVAGEGNTGWAMISENDRGIVVRVGDTLIGGETVTAIDSRGVWIEYDGIRELIPVQKTDFGTMVQIEPVNDAPSSDIALADVSITLEEASRDYISALLQDAGRLEWRDGDAARGLQVLTVSQGQIFDLMGLQPGDMILAVNGQTPQGLDLIADVPQFEGSGTAIELEILRNGAQHKVRVTLEQI